MKKFIYTIILIIYTAYAYGQSTPITLTAYTKFGKPVEVMIYAELTAQERAANDNWVSQTYPNAEILESSTSEYNCHGYVWIMKDGGAPSYLPQYNSSGGTNLSKYWTNDYYDETTESNNTIKKYIS